MISRTLSVVIPAYNAEATIGTTIDALAAALAHAPSFEADVLLVDDGSTDATAEAARSAAHTRIPLRVLSQPNRGRFEARRAGLEEATGDWVLLLDSRVTLEVDALRFVAGQIEGGAEIWNGHVIVEDGGNPLAAFWRLLGELAWGDYYAHPRTTSFGAADFDRYPKGTTCFLAPTSLVREAAAAFRSRYTDPRHANDDTPMLRSIAEQRRIHISPAFACHYQPRTSLVAFARHSVHRGVVFLDGHGRPESRFFPVVAGFYPVSAALALVTLRRPRALPLTALAVAAGAAAAGVAKRRSGFEVATLAGVTPLYAAGHGIGMWKGLAHMARRHLSAS